MQPNCFDSFSGAARILEWEGGTSTFSGVRPSPQLLRNFAQIPRPVPARKGESQKKWLQNADMAKLI